MLHLPDGRSVYFAGDTNVFSDMELIRDLYKPQLAMLPIGDRFTMGPLEAARACRLLQCERVIPMHFGTFPLLTGRPDGFESASPASRPKSGSSSRVTSEMVVNVHTRLPSGTSRIE